jgi:hypothetical protein
MEGIVSSPVISLGICVLSFVNLLNSVRCYYNTYVSEVRIKNRKLVTVINEKKWLDKRLHQAGIVCAVLTLLYAISRYYVLSKV